MKTTRIFTALIILFLTSTHLSAQDWPQFLGPDRNSKSPQENILRTWPEEGPEVLWTVPVGIGYGGPVVKEGKVYLLDRIAETSDVMRSFDLNTGEELWKYEYSAPGSVMFPGSRSVPIVDDNYVYSCGQYGDLYCFDLDTQQPVWNVNVWTDFGGEPGNAGSEGERRGRGEPGGFPTWAISQCPLIYGNMLIIASQAPQAGVVAYDKRNGKVVWKTPALGEVGYVSPTIVQIDGEDHVVMITASSGGRGGQEIKPGNVVGIHPENGKLLWKFENWICRIPAPAAVDAGENKILIVGGYELGALMLKVEKHSDGNYVATELYRTEEFGDQTKPALLHNGYFYAQYGTNNTRDGLTCMNMDGEIMWKTKRDPDFNKGSMILADGLILATDGSTKLYLIEPDPKEFKPIASAELLSSTEDGGRFGTQNWAPIALADGKLLIRDQAQMYCIKVAE